MRSGVKFVFATVFAVGIVPVGIVALMLTPQVTTFIATYLKMDRPTAIAMMIDYLALSYTVLLGVIVYQQTERINQLEVTQYDMYLGVESVDYSCELGHCFVSNEENGKGSITQALRGSQRIFLLNVEIGVNNDKPFFIPLSFIVKSQPLVVSIYFQKANLKVMDKGQTILSKEYAEDERINAIFADGSHFIFGLGLLLPKENNIVEIDFELTMEVESQIGQKQKIQSNTTLIQIDDRFDLLSSYSRRLS